MSLKNTKLPDFEEFEKRIEIEFKNKVLLKTAFAHRSFINENKSVVPEHNERLEFLGDAVLELVTTDFLFKKYPHKPEGELTAVRSAIVNTESIADAAKRLGMNDYLLLSKGESKDTGRARHYILADAFEALIGAIYLDQGYDVVQDFIAKNLFDKTDEIVNKKLWQDPKSRFQEKAQELYSKTPSYKLLKEEGPDHDKVFEVAAYIGSEQIASGKGRSKQEAEQNAAKAAIEKKSW